MFFVCLEMTNVLVFGLETSVETDFVSVFFVVVCLEMTNVLVFGLGSSV